MTMNVTQIIFSYDRPLQLDALCRSVLDNSDLAPTDIVAICRASGADYRRAYDQVGEQLGVRIVHENRLIPGVDLRWLQARLTHLGRVGQKLTRYIHRSLTLLPLPQQIVAQTQAADFVSLAVDDMVYYAQANFAEAVDVLQADPAIALWSWRIGQDLQPHPQMETHATHWVMAHAGTEIPYTYLFHTDGSLYRREDLVYWLAQVPPKNSPTLNKIESYLWRRYQAEPQAFTVGARHAGPQTQASITWQINRVSISATTNYFGAAVSEPKSLLAQYEQGTRLDFTPLYHSSEWVKRLNEGQLTTRGNKVVNTHVAPTPAAYELWNSLLVKAGESDKFR
jgi:hypothetical protein